MKLDLYEWFASRTPEQLKAAMEAIVNECDVGKITQWPGQKPKMITSAECFCPKCMRSKEIP